MEPEKSSSSSIVWVVLAAVLGMFAINLPRPSGDAPPSDNGAAQQSKGAAPAEKIPGDPLTPLRQFFGTDQAAAKNAATRPDPTIVDAQLRKNLADCDVQSLVVSMLDPIDSHLAYVFDQTVEVIDLAMGECDFVRDRYWLPWEEDRKDQVDGRIVGKARRDSPGVLLFRKTRASRDPEIDAQVSLCVVFLVGETPTTGFHKRALATALDLIDQYGLRGDGNKIRIVGPACSGSEDSLQLVMRDWGSQYQRRRVALAAASSVALQPWTAPLLAGELGLGDPIDVNKHIERISGSATAVYHVEGNDILKFQGTVRRADDVGRAVQHFFQMRNKTTHTSLPEKLALADLGESGQIAILYESNTGFGRAVTGQRLEQEKELLLQKKSLEPQKSPDILHLPFPVHFSRLKESVEQERQRKESRLGLPAPTTLVPQIREGKALQRDVYPAQDSGTIAAVNGEVLHVLLATIVREKIRYVGIVASDTRDQIFLTYALREYCPGVQVFIIGSDMLQMLPEYRLFMKGTVIGSTYPMYLPNQRWTELIDPSKGMVAKRVALPGDGAQGNYNAIVALMGRPEKMIEYRAPRLTTEKTVHPYPPVWISTIDQNGNFVPLQYFSCPVQDAYLREGPTDQAPPRIEPHVSNTGIAIAAICVGCLALLYRVFMKGWYRLIRDSDDVAAIGMTWEELSYRAVCLLALALMLAPVASMMHVYQQYLSRGEWRWWLSWVPLAVMVALLVAVIWPAPRLIGYWLRAKAPPGAAQPRWFIPASLVFAAFALIAGVLTWLFWQSGLNSWDALYFERAMSLESGLSPLVPLFFLSMAFFSWGYFQLQRCYLHSSPRYVVETPFADSADASPLADPSLGEIRTCDQYVHGCLDNMCAFIARHGRVHALLLAGTVILFWYLATYALLPTLEGPQWDWYFLLGFLAAFVLFGHSMARFFITWKHLEKLMGAIVLLPMVGAFDKLAGKIVGVFGGHLFAKRTRVSRRLVCAHQLGLLASATEAYAAEIRAAPDTSKLDQLDLVMDLARSLSAQLEQEKADELDGKPVAQHTVLVRDLCKHLFTLLVPVWKARPMKEAFGTGPLPEEPTQPANPQKPAPSAAEKLWIDLAEEFVASWTVIYLSQFFVQLRSAAFAIVACSSMLLLAGSSYPFFPERLKIGLLLALALSGVGFVVYVLVQINKNELVSRVTRTTPGHFSLDRGFIMSVLQFGAPLIAITIGLLGTFRFLLEPILRLVM